MNECALVRTYRHVITTPLNIGRCQIAVKWRILLTTFRLNKPAWSPSIGEILSLQTNAESEQDAYAVPLSLPTISNRNGLGRRSTSYNKADSLIQGPFHLEAASPTTPFESANPTMPFESWGHSMQGMGKDHGYVGAMRKRMNVVIWVKLHWCYSVLMFW